MLLVHSYKARSIPILMLWIYQLALYRIIFFRQSESGQAHDQRSIAMCYCVSVYAIDVIMCDLTLKSVAVAMSPSAGLTRQRGACSFAFAWELVIRWQSRIDIGATAPNKAICHPGEDLVTIGRSRRDLSPGIEHVSRTYPGGIYRRA